MTFFSVPIPSVCYCDACRIEIGTSRILVSCYDEPYDGYVVCSPVCAESIDSACTFWQPSNTNTCSCCNDAPVLHDSDM